MEIKGFFGRYRWLSNFWITPVQYEEQKYVSVEHAYQAAKSLNMLDRNYIAGLNSPKEAKAEGYKLNARPDWEDIKLDIMYQLVKDKFTRSSHLREWLKATGDTYLEETNTWGDTFWGVCDGIGENHLGKILMRVREELLST